MKYSAVFLLLAASALAQPVLVPSYYCPSGTPCMISESGDYASANSIRISIQTDLQTKRVYAKCGASTGNYAYQKEHQFTGTMTQTANDRGRIITFGGLKPNTTYYCVAGASVNNNSTGGSVESAEFTATTGAKSADEFAEPRESILPDTMTMPTPTVTYNVASDCADLQAKWDAMATDHATLPDVNREIVIPAGAVCGQLIERNHRTGTGWVIVRSSAVGTTNFPPAGVRLDPVRYQAQMVRIQTPSKSALGLTKTVSAVYANDYETRVWHAGLIFEGTPTVDNIVPKQQTSTCTPDAGGVIVSVTGNHYFVSNASKVYIISNSSITGLQGNWYTVSGVTGIASNFVLTGTGGLTGVAGNCVYAVRGDMKLANCRAGTGGVIRCDTTDKDGNPVDHGLGTDQVVKVLSPDKTFTEDWTNYTGTYGFGGRTNTSTPAWTDKITVVDSDTLEFQGRMPNGTYDGNARLLYDAANIPQGYWADDPTGTSYANHLVFDRVWFHAHGLMAHVLQHVRIPCSSDCMIRDSTVDPNWQWVMTYGSNYDIRTITYATNGTNVNIDWTRANSAVINNTIGYNLIGVSGSSNNSGWPLITDMTIRRNTFYFPCETRGWTANNPCGTGLTTNYNRQPLEWKAAEHNTIDANRFYGMPSGQDRGAAMVLASRAGADLMDPPRNGYNRQFSHRITNNTILSNGVGIEIAGSDTSDQFNDTPNLRRVWIKNNIIVVDGGRYRQNDPSGGGQGRCIELTHGVENATVDHNLCLHRGGTSSAVVAGSNKSVGFRITNNIFTSHTNAASSYPLQSGSNSYEITPIAANLAWGNTSWQQWTRGMLQLGGSTTVTGGTSAGTYQDMDPSLVFANNAFITSVRGGDPPLGFDTDPTPTGNTTIAQCQSDLGGFIDSDNFPRNICFDAGNSIGSGADTWIKREQAAGFFKWDRLAGPFLVGRAYDFHLRYDSPFKSGATTALNSLCASGQCLKASDGTDLGPDIDKLESAQGLVKNARVFGVTSSAATVAYLAPDSAACAVDYWKGTDTPTRVSDGGGARVRNVIVSGLVSGSLYYARVQCAVEQPELIFTTLP